MQYSCKGHESKWGEQTVWLIFEIKKHNFLNVIIVTWRHDFIELVSVRRRTVNMYLKTDFAIYLMPCILK